MMYNYDLYMSYINVIGPLHIREQRIPISLLDRSLFT